MDWLLVFAGGLLGSSHCVGMCGGFALALGAREPSRVRNLIRQIVYCLGRVSTYALGGAMAGFAGQRLMAEMPAIVRVQAALCLMAGGLLIVQGLGATGLLSGVARSSGIACLGPSMFGSLLRATRTHSVFLAGVANGLLPCGLVYAYLALAASTHDMLIGTEVMAAFGLGTMPVMVAVGCGSGLLSRATRCRVNLFASWCVVATGVLSVARGVGFLLSASSPDPAQCPFCL